MNGPTQKRVVRVFAMYLHAVGTLRANGTSESNGIYLRQIERRAQQATRNRLRYRTPHDVFHQSFKRVALRS